MAVDELAPVVPPEVDAALVRMAAFLSAFGHPYRLRIMVLMHYADRALSPVELAELMHARLGTVAYHVRTLRETGMIEPAFERRKRGAVQHYYRLSEKGQAIVKWAVENA